MAVEVSARKTQSHDDMDLDIASSEFDAFLKVVKRALEARKPPGLRPFPVLVAGKDVDLLLLSRKAKALGGYEKISAAGMWGEVSKELGFEPHCGPSVKLVYLKYLKVLETGNVLRSAEQNARFPSRVVEQEHGQDAKRRRLGKENLQHGIKPAGRAEKDIHRAAKSPGGAASSSVVVPATSLASPLEWIRRLALDPGDPRSGQGLPGSVQDKQWVQECFVVANRIRSCLWKKEDPQEAKQRTPRGEENWKQGSRRRATQYSLRPPKPALPHLSKRVPIGAAFQAYVPPYQPHAIHIDVEKDEEGGSHTEADAVEFIGKVVWPREGLVLSTDRVGKGSSSVRCYCVDKRSIQCVKVHVEETKEKLRMELGETFKQWGFDKMGDSVAEGWRLDEQKRFKAIVGTNAASKEKDFWAELPVAFPHRSRKDLVSFYFNVFMLRRRAVQNRIGVKTDSDDDEGNLPESASISGDRNLAVPDDTGEEAQSAENLHAGTSADTLRI